MKFGGIGVPELLIILAVALLIFGPKNLPKLGAALGKTVKNIRDGMDGSGKDKDSDETEPAAKIEAETKDSKDTSA
ncbi:MAG: twin-arginine translocase TatA/TatE family subunit [Actinobacteria bacterium]|nr:twin-arginine translocase TatA/TatE family subunit [Actinomycetota bacterium]